MINFLLLLIILILCTCSIINKETVSRLNPFTIQWIQGLLNIILLPIWYYLSKRHVPNEIITKSSLLLALSAGILSTLGFILFLTVLKDKPVFIVTACLSTYPALTMLILGLYGGGKITTSQILGVLIILAGVLTIQIGEKIK